MTSPLSHFDDSGASRMVDVSSKPVTVRTAKAEGVVTMHSATLDLIHNRQIAKGDVLEVARLAGIMGAKKTSELIPLCHPLPIDAVEIEFVSDGEHSQMRVVSQVRTTARTGVEMEALTAATVAALTIYDMCKSVDRGIALGPFRLLEKQGGRSGNWQAVDDSDAQV